MSNPSSSRPVRFLVPWSEPSSHARLATLLGHPNVAAVGLSGAALADATACRALAASVHSATQRPDDGNADLPALVVVDPRDLPDDLAPPAPRHLALDLAAGGEDFEVTLKVLTWARPVAEMGVDLVLSPRLERTPPLDDGVLAARLSSAWTEALLAAGLVACAGPWRSGEDPDDSDGKPGDAWTPFGAALAHGLEAVFVDQTPASLEPLRELADDLVVVGGPVSDVDQAAAARDAGIDLIPLATGLAPDEIEAILESVPAAGASRFGARVDRLREDWLV